MPSRCVGPALGERTTITPTRAGVGALKLRLHSQDWRVDLPVIEAVRDAVGADLEIMVDANQGWRMPGDVTPRWDLRTASEFAHGHRVELARDHRPAPSEGGAAWNTVAGSTAFASFFARNQ